MIGRMRHLRALARVCAIAAATVAATSTQAETWPTQTVRFVTPGAPGSAPDRMARLYADRLSKLWRQTVVVENIPGAGMVLAVQTFLRARDRHTLLLTPSGIAMVAPVLRSNLPYDPKTDLKPIAAVTLDYLAIVVPSSLGVDSIDALTALARAKPGALNWYGSPGAPYLTLLNFFKRRKLELTYLPYREGGSGPVMKDLAAGTIHVAMVPLTPVRGLAAADKVRVLAITNGERAAAMPDIPTVAEAGYAELGMEGVIGAFGWREMPDDLAKRIAADFRQVSTDDQLANQLTASGQVARVTDPADYQRYLAAQLERWRSIVRANDVQPIR